MIDHFTLLFAFTVAPVQGATSTETPPAVARSADDSVLVAADEALATGRPWRASRLVAPVVADSGRRTPAAVMLAATAASRWSGWAEVERLLGNAAWLDSLYPGDGHRLLARAALERGRDSVAIAHATAAVAGARDAAGMGAAFLLLARALDRIEARDSAARSYQRAATLLPELGDWLRLRAAGATVDSAGRAALYDAIADSLVRARVPATEAAVHARTGDLTGAAARYSSIGRPLQALRLRLATMHGPAVAGVRAALLSFIGTRAGAGEVASAITLADSAFPRLTPAEQLTIARSAGESGLAVRAVEGFRAAFAAGLGTRQDRFAYANALFRLARYGEAAFQYNLVGSKGPLAAPAAYRRARAMVRDGQITEAKSALHAVTERFRRDTAAASTAFYLLADLATDERRDADARALFRRLALRYPTSRFAAAARFRAAIIAYVRGQPRLAATELDTLARRYSGSDEALAATYWSGRAWAAAGDTALARQRWEEVVTRNPLSYYAGASERRLNAATWAPLPASDSFPVVPALDSGMVRAALLERLGLAPEARAEYDRLTRLADESPERLIATAAAFRSVGRASQAIRLGRRALARGATPDARLYRLIYPVIHEDALVAEAADQRLDPSFVAALIRQESMFNPAATSPMGARGLMQIMPDLGGRLATTLGFPVWDPVLLYEPDVSLQLGTVHLAELIGRYDHPARILAAYNAGVSRVERWVTKAGTGDPEVFAERIPYVETRDYVRIIQRNQDIYRALYAWNLPASAPAATDLPQ